MTTEHVGDAMAEFVDFLGFISGQLHTREIARFETMLMPANFSSLVGEFMGAGILAGGVAPCRRECEAAL